ncbi:MAG: phosphate ABC transporter substrate-binding protein PstS [Burkholderiaceae bacterium]
MKTPPLLSLVLALAMPAAGLQAAEITGAGATFPAPVYAKWAEVYRDKTGHAVNYQAIGSGGGIKQIKAMTVDFGATDDPMTAKALKRSDLLQFPAVIGGIVPVVSVEGVAPGQMTLNGETLAGIFSGRISQWNDPAIAALNAGLSLPAAPITVVYRSDSSGTTAGFTTYLAEVVPEFEKAVGAGKTVNWPTGIGGKGNAGVAANVLKLKNAIGYVEYAYAKQNKMSHTALLNKAGKRVQPDNLTFAAAAAGAEWTKAEGFGISLNNQAGDEAWPITSASFIVVYRKPENPTRAGEVLKFFRWAFSEGQALATELDYVPLPAATTALIEKAWQGVTDPAGKPVLP